MCHQHGIAGFQQGLDFRLQFHPLTSTGLLWHTGPRLRGFTGKGGIRLFREIKLHGLNVGVIHRKALCVHLKSTFYTSGPENLYITDRNQIVNFLTSMVT